MRDMTAGRTTRLKLAGAFCALVVLAVAGSALAAAGDFGQPSTSPESAGDTAHGITSADFNGDLEDDLAVANQAGTVTILLGDGTGNFTAASGSPETAPGAWDVAAGDLDNDDDEDLAVAGANVSILLNDGSGDFAAALTETLGNQPRAIGIADMNADTDLDVVVGQFFNPQVTVLINDGDDDGDFTALASEDASEVGQNNDNLSNITVGNIDNDSDVDVMV